MTRQVCGVLGGGDSAMHLLHADLDCNPLTFNYFSFEFTNCPVNTCRPSNPSNNAVVPIEGEGGWGPSPLKISKIIYYNIISFVDSMFIMYTHFKL